ncbi:MAG: hypothetical protein ACLTG7_00630 [Romboutsia sp.]
MVEVLYWNESAVINALAESLVMGGLPKHAGVPKAEDLWTEIYHLAQDLSYLWENRDEISYNATKKTLEHRYSSNMFLNTDINKYIKRGLILGNVKAGSGHNCMFKGVQFNMIINMPLYWLKEYQRYHFTDIISSQSTMHCVTQMDIKEHCSDRVEPIIIDMINKGVEYFNSLPKEAVKERKEAFNYIVANLPSDFHLAMGITMNYLQALSMVKQREHHKLDDWSEDFVPFLKELPFFKLFMLGEWN